MRQRRVTRFGQGAAVALMLAMAAACAHHGSPVSPSSTTSTASAPTVPTDVTATAVLALSHTDIDVQWTVVPNATGYVIEAGKTAGSAELGTFQSTGASYVWNKAPLGKLYLQVRAKNAVGTSDASSPVAVTSIDLRDYIDAIFMGEGPLTPTDGNDGCGLKGVWDAYPRGDHVRVLASSTVPAADRERLQEVVAEVPQVTDGWLSDDISGTSQSDPIPSRNEVTVTVKSDAYVASFCGKNYSGCSAINWVNDLAPGTLLSSRVVLYPEATRRGYAHEMGHSLLGFCHVDGNTIGGAYLCLMSAGPNVFSLVAPGDVRRDAPDLSPYDIAALKAVYAAGLHPGATLAEFKAAGLVK